MLWDLREFTYGESILANGAGRVRGLVIFLTGREPSDPVGWSKPSSNTGVGELGGVISRSTVGVSPLCARIGFRPNPQDAPNRL